MVEWVTVVRWCVLGAGSTDCLTVTRDIKRGYCAVRAERWRSGRVGLLFEMQYQTEVEHMLQLDASGTEWSKRSVAPALSAAITLPRRENARPEALHHVNGRRPYLGIMTSSPSALARPVSSHKHTKCLDGCS
jgi:hypothetical protein